MRKISAIIGKELKTYFKSPVAYLVLIITVSVFNVFFYMIIDENREASLRDVFKLMEFMFVFFVPILTMRIFAEENQTGTIEFLLTTPTTTKQIIVGKYLGSLIFISLIIVLTLPYYFIIRHFASPDGWEAFWGFVGVFLEVALFTALGVLASCCTKGQTTAAISSYVMNFTVYFSFSFIKYLSGPWEGFVRTFSTIPHLENFSVGFFSLADFVYYLSGIWFCLFLTKLIIEKRQQ